MVAEVVRLLITARDGIYVDATVGGAGHAVEILKNLSSGAQYLGLDADPEAVVAARERLGADRRVTIRQARFSQLSDILQALGLPSCDGIFADLGVSSHQLNEAGRGFSYLSEGPLDMRMDPTRGKSAFELLQTVDENTLSGILQKYGEERLARRIARAILKHRQQQPIRTTRELAGIVESVTPFQKRIKTLSRVFQALRIAVNEELQELEKFLPAA
ncbi:MAG: 16S rRNA (cytosine(1402)-N(4))-methyltransferase RsmH, partial [Calditrichaeota bacterium]